jgi:methylase of polypeptide subunit release factors
MAATRGAVVKQTDISLSKADATATLAGWSGSAWQSESTFHQLAPYIGKTKSSMAANLVSTWTSPGDLVYDPFSGSGTIAFETWAAGRRVIANDLSPYAALLTRAKLFPYRSLKDALDELRAASRRASRCSDQYDLRSVPAWVREFFHPKTLRDTLAWTAALSGQRHAFLLSCLMGILHHQRPGFLSFPSSHTVPYLRIKRFPRKQFADLYEYRSVADRLEAKVRRAFRRVPKLSFGISRDCHVRRADHFTPDRRVDAILTSPPYMRQLDYGRDNRLRLWFLGCQDSDALDKLVSPREVQFLGLMRRCFRRWKETLKLGGVCVLVVGDTDSRSRQIDLPDTVAKLATDGGDYKLVHQMTDLIPNERRVRRGITGSTAETILVLRKT